MQPISESRKIAHYLGLTLVVLGLLSFGSVFVSAALNAGNFSNFDGQMQSSMFRAFGGFILIFIGGVLSVIGSQGLAGSGVILDPERARADLEPQARMAGGVLRDVLDEAGLPLKSDASQRVMIRCMTCKTLNDETAKFCQECGNPL